MTVIDMSDYQNRRVVTLLQFRGRLRLEIKGLKFKGVSTLKALNRMEGTDFKRKQEALDYVIAELEKYGVHPLP